MKIDPKLAHGAISLQFCRGSRRMPEIDRTLKIIPEVIGRLRAVMPVHLAGIGLDLFLMNVQFL